MHISEGVLSGPVLISGGALAAAGTAIGLKNLDYDRIARAGMLSAAFFVASLIHVPVGPANAHLILNGLVGLLLGWAALSGHPGGACTAGDIVSIRRHYRFGGQHDDHGITGGAVLHRLQPISS